MEEKSSHSSSKSGGHSSGPSGSAGDRSSGNSSGRDDTRALSQKLREIFPYSEEQKLVDALPIKDEFVKQTICKVIALLNTTRPKDAHPSLDPNVSSNSASSHSSSSSRSSGNKGQNRLFAFFSYYEKGNSANTFKIIPVTAPKDMLQEGEYSK